VRALKARTPEAWAELYDTYYEQLRKYAVGRLGSREDAEDIASLAFLRALHRIDSYRSTGKPIIAWLYGIAQNLLREAFRKPGQILVKAGLSSRDGEPDDAGANDPDLAQVLDLKAALEELTPRQREVVTLLHYGGFSVKEVAAILGKRERSVYYLEARALLRLKEVLLAQDGG
jgi:RNA polymerase sigma-70 factor (ECF subfamily)